MVTKTEILWRQYAQFVELYKFYMDLILKLNVFYYAVMTFPPKADPSYMLGFGSKSR
jgi:hypothetical protein